MGVVMGVVVGSSTGSHGGCWPWAAQPWPTHRRRRGHLRLSKSASSCVAVKEYHKEGCGGVGLRLYAQSVRGLGVWMDHGRRRLAVATVRRRQTRAPRGCAWGRPDSEGLVALSCVRGRDPPARAPRVFSRSE